MQCLQTNDDLRILNCLFSAFLSSNSRKLTNDFELLKPIFSFFSFVQFQISCIASIYNLYKERADKVIEIEPTVFSASASQSFIDRPSSQYSSYHDSYDSASNHNDAQIQGKLHLTKGECTYRNGMRKAHMSSSRLRLV